MAANCDVVRPSYRLTAPQRRPAGACDPPAIPQTARKRAFEFPILESPVLAALLIYRGAYFLLPLAVAGGLYFWLERLPSVHPIPDAHAPARRLD